MLILMSIWLMLAPSATAGACANPDDHAWLASHYTRLGDVSKDCAFECLTDDAACAAACVREATGLGAACSDCFGALVDCTVSNCALRCIVASSDMCIECRAEHCDRAFVRCAGVEIRR